MFEAMLVIIIVLSPDKYIDMVVKVPSAEMCASALDAGRKTIETDFPKGTPYIMVCRKLKTTGEVSA